SHSEALNIHRDELSEITNVHMSHYCGICGQAGHNSRTCNLDNTTQDGYNDTESDNLSLSVEKYNEENLNIESTAKNYTSYENTSRHYSACGQVGYNARTCKNQTDDKNNDLPLSIPRHNVESFSTVDKNLTSYDNKLRHCGTCGQTGHNARICCGKN
ncbi:41769_t:CDS:2, partial [Gigaspora margarita]